MACNPALMVDPFGLASGAPLGQSNPNPLNDPLAYAKAMFPTMHRYVPGGDLFNAGNFARNSMMQETQTRIEILAMLYKLDEALGSLGYESKSISEALGRSTCGDVVKGNDQYTEHSDGDWSKNGEKGTRVTLTLRKLLFNYSIFKNVTRAGIYVFANYKGDLSEYSETDWIQSVVTDSPTPEKPFLRWFNDYIYGDPNNDPPFYYSKDDDTKSHRKK